MLPSNNKVPDNLPVANEPQNSNEPDVAELIQLVQALQHVYARLVAEGHRWQDGRLIPPGDTNN